LIVAIHQPAYLPWLGYLARIAAVDAFVFLDTVQFEKNSFINRNKIKSSTGPVWLTVPVQQKGHLSKALREVEIDESTDWRTKHLRTIEQNYRRAPYFQVRQEYLEQLVGRGNSALSDLCFEQLKFWTQALTISTPILRASNLPVAGTKSDLVLNICKHLNATAYLSGPLGKGYLDEASFQQAGISISYHQYIHPVYNQLYQDFIPGMSVVDYWMNTQDLELFRDRK
jgi:WbqC-like protein family